MAANSAAQCTAGFDTVTNGLTVQFDNQSTGTINWMFWDFGDGNTAQNVANPQHTYAQPGFYTVCQIIQDTVNFTCYDYFCDTLALGGATCEAQFFQTTSGLEVEVFFDGLGTFDSLRWDFGDGSPLVYALNPNHTYAAAGTYTICLLLYNQGSLCDTSCQTITIGGAGCLASFQLNQSGATVQVSDQSTGDYDSRYFDMGDGIGFFTTATAQHTYTADGTYEVCLTIYNASGGGCTDQVCQTVVVDQGGGGGGGCQASFTAETNALDLSLTNTSTGDFFVATYNYGDGNFGIDPSHTYAAAGSYEVCLTIIGLGCLDESCQTIEVSADDCEPSFTWSFNEQNGFQFTNTTTVGNYGGLLWDFGDGNTSTFENPLYYYNQSGVFSVCLTALDGGVSCGQHCEEVNVFPLGVEHLKGAALSVFPNPTQGLFGVNSSRWPVVYSLLDASGRLVQHGALHYQYQKVSAPAGLYYLQLNDGVQSLTLPLVVLN